MFLDVQAEFLDGAFIAYLTGLAFWFWMVSAIPSIAWNRIEKYVRYDKIFTAGFVVMKSAYWLKCNAASSLVESSCKLPNKCPTRNRQRNKPVKAIQYFFAMEDFKNADFAIMFV